MFLLLYYNKSINNHQAVWYVAGVVLILSFSFDFPFPFFPQHAFLQGLHAKQAARRFSVLRHYNTLIYFLFG
jgi:hypothetical protein